MKEGLDHFALITDSRPSSRASLQIYLLDDKNEKVIYIFIYLYYLSLRLYLFNYKLIFRWLKYLPHTALFSLLFPLFTNPPTFPLLLFSFLSLPLNCHPTSSWSSVPLCKIKRLEVSLWPSSTTFLVILDLF